MHLQFHFYLRRPNIVAKLHDPVYKTFMCIHFFSGVHSGILFQSDNCFLQSVIPVSV